MTNITRWDPFQELANMRLTLDRMFDQPFTGRSLFRGNDAPVALSLDVRESEDAFLVQAAIPGVEPKDVSIEVEGDVLTISGEFGQEEANEGETFLRREIRWGSFSRALQLPPTVDPAAASATFENGMLKLSLPKKPEAKTLKISITPEGVTEGESTRVIEG